VTTLDRLHYLHELQTRVKVTAESTGHVYVPRGACTDVIESTDSEVLIAGPAGTGKSRACLEKILQLSLAHPSMRTLIVRKTLTSLTASGMVTWKRDVVPEAEAAGLVWYYGGSSVVPAQWKFKNGSSVVIGGMDRSMRVMSTDYDLIFVQEATELTEDDWEALSTRLRSGVLPFQQLLADCNPSHEAHWLKRRCDQGKTRMLLSVHENNPTLYDDDGVMTDLGAAYIGRLDALTGVRYQRLRLGRWSSAEGAIYEQWNPAIHLVNTFTIPDDWERFWSVDFGFTNPFVAQCWAIDGDGRMYLYREWYMTGRTVAEHAATILRTVAPDGVWIEPKPKVIVCDHDSDRQGKSMRDILGHALGIRTKAARKDVMRGIQTVQARLELAADGQPRLYIVRDALVEADETLRDHGRPVCTEEEIPGYVWDAQPGKPPKEQPRKVDDHGCDAKRYAVMHIDKHAGKTGPGRGRQQGQLPTRIG